MTNKELFDKYKDVKVRLESYYKFRFTFEGISDDDGKNIIVRYGECADDICRMHINVYEEYPVSDFHNESCDIEITENTITFC